MELILTDIEIAVINAVSRTGAFWAEVASTYLTEGRNYLSYTVWNELREVFELDPFTGIPADSGVAIKLSAIF